MLSAVLLPFVALASLASAQTALQINTPGNIIQCQKTLLTYSGGTPPYYLSILPGRSLANPYEAIFPTNDLTYSWNCDLGENTTVTLGIKDSIGTINFSGVLVVGKSPTNDSSCIGSNAVIEASVALTRSSTPSPAAASTAASATGGSSGAAAASTTAAPATTTAASTGGARSEFAAGNKGALALFAVVVLGGAALVGL